MSPEQSESALPLFLPEWSVWDAVINRHYEDASHTAKEFMFNLAMKNADRQDKLGVIPHELAEALNAAFGHRAAFNFLLENCASKEPVPEILRLPFPDGKPLHHLPATLLLAFWKSLSSSEVYVVKMDNGMNLQAEFEKIGIQLTRLKFMGCEEALKILKERC